MERESLDPVLSPHELLAAMIDSGLGKVKIARGAKVGMSTIQQALKGEYVGDEPLYRLAKFLNLPCHIGPRRFTMTEWAMRDKTAARLQRDGFEVITEHSLPSGRKADIVARKDGAVKYIIEAKVKDVLAGIGQLYADQLELQSDATLVLLVAQSLDRRIVKQVCEKLGIELWVDS